VGKQNLRYIIVNGEIIGPYNDVRLQEFSKDGSTWVASFEVDSEWYILFSDGHTVGPFGYLLHIFLSYDGSSWGALIREGNKQSVIINGEEWGPYSSIGFLRFNEDNSWVFTYYDSEDEHMVIDGELSDSYQYISSQNYLKYDELEYSVYKGSDDEKYVMKNDETWGPYKYIYLHVEDDECGERKSYFTANDSNGVYYLIMDDIQYGPYKYIEMSRYYPVKYSSDGTKWVFVSSKEDEKYLVINGIDYGPYEFVDICKDNNRLIYFYLEDIGDGYYRVVRVVE
jgi:hypothetical protein